MAEKVMMLALSPTMDTGLIANWVKKEGDPVVTGDVLCEVETDKATMDYEAVNEGILLKIVLPEGSKAAVGDTIAIIGKAGEDYANLLVDEEHVETDEDDAKAPAETAADIGAVASEPVNFSKSGDKQAGRKENAAGSVAAEGAGGAARDSVQSIAKGTDKGMAQASDDDLDQRLLRSSPLARKIATENDILLSTVNGSGPRGRIVKKDIDVLLVSKNTVGESGGDVTNENTQKTQSTSSVVKEPISATEPRSGGGANTMVPVSGKRKVIARRLSESKFSAPHYYLKVSVQMDALMEARKRLETSGGKASFNAFIMKFIAQALVKHPLVNSGWAGENIVRFGSADIGLAVAQPDGLITPVVRSCERLGIQEIDDALKALIPKAQKGTLQPEEYSNASFTVSNLGAFGIEEFTAIINPPGAAILAIGQMTKTPVVDEMGAVVVKTIMKMTLSCDHRVIDGAVGAVFLDDLRKMLEDPWRALY